MRRYTSYIWYVLRHKWFVFWECLKLGVPIWIALAHDWDKFLPGMIVAYARAVRDKNGKDIRADKASPEFAHAWMMHQHRNKHHWQHWLWVSFPSHNCGAPLWETDYMVWDNGEIQRVVKRSSGNTYWYEQQELFPSDYLVYTLMPERWCREMLADWRGAGKAMRKPDTLAWYTHNRSTLINFIHPLNIEWLDDQLGFIG